MFIHLGVIRSFADGETKRLWETRKNRRLPPEVIKRALLRLERVDAAIELSDLAFPPSHKLHPLVGNRAGQHAIWINDQWRVCFRFRDGDAYDVEITDYH